MNKKAFTLIEIIVAITITSMVLVSIVQIFLFSWVFSKKIDSSRIMQENIKNFTEIIAEDVRNNWINLKNTWSNLTLLKTWTWTSLTEYYLSSDWWSTHVLIRKTSSGSTEKLNNSWITFENLKFDISWTKKDIPKVTMYFTVKPALKKWLNAKQIENSKIIMQTTFSERLYKYK